MFMKHPDHEHICQVSAATPPPIIN